MQFPKPFIQCSAAFPILLFCYVKLQNPFLQAFTQTRFTENRNSTKKENVRLLYVIKKTKTDL